MDVLENIEKPAKRTYQKHKVTKKVGVVAYLNKRLKGMYGNTRFHLYWQITFNGMNTQIKSESFGKIGVSEYEFQNDNMVKQKIEWEKQKIESSIWDIIDYYEKEFNKTPKISEIVKYYSEIYIESIGEMVNHFLGLYLSIGIQNNDMYDFYKKHKKEYPPNIYEDQEDGFNYDDFGTLDAFKGSPEVNLNIIYRTYPKIYDFLKAKFPSPIWRIYELIYLIENMPNREERGFNDSIYEYNSKFTWYDFKTGKLKRGLYYLGVLNGFLSDNELLLLLNDLAKINFFNFVGGAKDYWCQSQMHSEYAEYLKKVG